jgi:hypothetical protein
MAANNNDEEMCKELIATYFKVTFQNRHNYISRIFLE